MRISVRSYFLTVLIGAGVCLLGLALIGPHPDKLATQSILSLTAFALATGLVSYQTNTSARGSIVFIPVLAALLLSPSLACVVAVAGLVLVTSLSWQRSALKVSFNVAQSTLAGALSSIVFLALGGIPMISDPAALAVPTRVTQLVPAAALVLVFMLTNSLSVTGIIALSSNRPVLASWGSAVRQTFAYDVLFSPAAYLVALVYLKVGIFGVVLLTVPLLLVRKFYKTNYELERVNQELLELMVKAIEARDPYTSGHSRRVAQYSRVIGRAIGLSGTELDRVAVAALLHDVGKIHEVYAPILRKPEKLSPAEWSVMQSHPIKSAELVSTVSHLKDVVAPIRHHHENWDGTGYPDGLQGNAIPLAARIILFADTIDAMTTDRPYRKALTEVQVRSELVKFRGKQFDPEMCDKLLASPMFGLLFAPHQRTRTPERTKPVLGSRTEGVIAR